METKMTTILVCGGRKYNNYAFIRNTLNKLLEERNIVDPIIVHGRANGADALARVWAMEREFRDRGYPAKWSKDHTRAGPIRNEQMLSEEKIDLVVSFPGGSGTAHMVNLARSLNIEIIKATDENYNANRIENS